MASQQIEVRVPAPVQAPRGAVQAGMLAAWLLQGIGQALHALASRQATPHQRSRRSDLRALAQDVEAQHPALAAELRGIAMHCEALQRQPT